MKNSAILIVALATLTACDKPSDEVILPVDEAPVSGCDQSGTPEGSESPICPDFEDGVENGTAQENPSLRPR